MAAGNAAAERYRRQQSLISAVLTRDVIRLLRDMFDPANPDRSWQAIQAAIAALVHDRRGQSAELAARFYRQARQDADLPDDFPPRPAVPLPDTQVLAIVVATGIAVYRRALRAGATPQRAVDRAAVTSSGAASRLALTAGRSVIAESVRHDGDALGWIRLTGSDPCSWCLMLASRGAVYRTADSAGRAQNARFDGDGEFKWHDHCGCQAVPIFDEGDPMLARADDLYDQWVQVTNGHSGQDAINAWRRYWANSNSKAK